MQDKIYPEFFRREDNRPDALFYQQPRLVSHIDQAAKDKVLKWYSDLLPPAGHILDLMASWDSHLPTRFHQVTGLGLNQVELEQNPVLTQRVIFDLNRSDDLPFPDRVFDGVVCTVSVQYMTRPAETFAEVARVLKPAAPFVVTFSNRMFPTKAVLAWRASDDEAHIRLVQSYFRQAGNFAEAQVCTYQPLQGDPLFAVWAKKCGDYLASG